MENQNYNQNVTQNEAPAEIRKWNWGAFAFSLFWGLGNKVYLSLLCLIPLVNIVMIFVLGAKGNEWAWQNNVYRDTEEFKRVQETWNRAGFIWFIVTLALVVLYIILFAALGVSFMNMYSNTYY